MLRTASQRFSTLDMIKIGNTCGADDEEAGSDDHDP
jgi:hypothetical protein